MAEARNCALRPVLKKLRRDRNTLVKRTALAAYGVPLRVQDVTFCVPSLRQYSLLTVQLRSAHINRHAPPIIERAFENS